MKVIFMGTPEFACPSLQALIEQPNYDVVAVYTQPPRPSGRGHKVQISPVHALARQHNIPVETPKTLKHMDVQQALIAYQPDIIVVVAYGLILPQKVLDIPQYGCINVHGSLLPRWRGAAPIHRALIAGDTITGITIMKMDAGLDSGPIILMKEMPIHHNVFATDLSQEMAQLGARYLINGLKSYLDKTTIPIPQPEEGVTYAPKIARQEGAMDWTKSAYELERTIRAFDPWPGTWFEFDNTRLRVYSAKAFDLNDNHRQIEVGKVIESPLIVKCGFNTALEILQLQRPGGKILEVGEFLNGFQLPIGADLKI